MRQALKISEGEMANKVFQSPISLFSTLIDFLSNFWLRWMESIVEKDGDSKLSNFHVAGCSLADILI